MIRHILMMTRALAAIGALSLSAVACSAPTDANDTSDAEETSQDLVSRSAFFDTFQGANSLFYFNLTAANGESVLRSQGYTRLASAQGGVASVLANASNAANFDLKQATNGDWFFDVVAANGETIGTSELYASKSNAERGARTVRGLVSFAKDATVSAPRRESFELFEGEDGKPYFHLRAGNGEIVLVSQAYASIANARVGIASVFTNGEDVANYQVFETESGAYALRLVAKNGEVIARGQAYSSKSDATRAVTRLTQMLSSNVNVLTLP